MKLSGLIMEAAALQFCEYSINRVVGSAITLRNGTVQCMQRLQLSEPEPKFQFNT